MDPLTLSYLLVLALPVAAAISAVLWLVAALGFTPRRHAWAAVSTAVTMLLLTLGAMSWAGAF